MTYDGIFREKTYLLEERNDYSLFGKKFLLRYSQHRKSGVHIITKRGPI